MNGCNISIIYLAVCSIWILKKITYLFNVANPIYTMSILVWMVLENKLCKMDIKRFDVSDFYKLSEFHLYSQTCHTSLTVGLGSIIGWRTRSSSKACFSSIQRSLTTWADVADPNGDGPVIQYGPLIISNAKSNI